MPRHAFVFLPDITDAANKPNVLMICIDNLNDWTGFLKDDVGESKNLLASMPEKAVKLKAQLDAVLKGHDATIPIAVPAKPSRPARKKRRANSTTH